MRGERIKGGLNRMELVREVLRHEPAPARSRPGAPLAIDICGHLLRDRFL